MENEGHEWLIGHFLISDVNLIDPNFRRSVVLMINLPASADTQEAKSTASAAHQRLKR